jgi:UTP:GlnB (protein PII) uridylyltransferase
LTNSSSEFDFHQFIPFSMAIANNFISSRSIFTRSRVPCAHSVDLHPFKFSTASDRIFSSATTLTIRKNLVYASIDGVGSTSLKSEQDADYVPMPVVLIDQDSDSEATIVQVSFGDRLGALIDTMKALKELGLDVAKGTVTTEESVTQTKFFIKNALTGRKVEEPDLLEGIRLTFINNLLKYHPESSERLAMGEAFGIKAPEKNLDVDILTHIRVKDDGPKRSLLCIETADRPGLLLEIIKIMNDINVNVEFAEIDTEGLVAKDKFHVSYRGAALNASLSEVLVNCLRYYLRRPITDEDSY